MKKDLLVEGISGIVKKAKLKKDKNFFLKLSNKESNDEYDINDDLSCEESTVELRNELKQADVILTLPIGQANLCLKDK